MRITTSVSIFSRMIGAAMAVSALKGSGRPVLHLAHVDDGARDRGGSGHCWAGEVGTGTWSLPADEIAVRCRDGALARRDSLAIGRQAHGAAGLAPFEAGV